LQAKLLRAVDDRVFEPVGSGVGLPLRARLIAATNVPLDDEVSGGRFRGDLYFRINVVGFFLPPLRARRSAIVPLANEFLHEMTARNRPDVCGFSRDVVRVLEQYAWPGNIRELRNIVERAVALCPGPAIELADLPDVLTQRIVPIGAATSLRQAAKAGLPPAAATLIELRASVEQKRIQEALEKHENNRCRTAAALGISRMALYNKLHKYGLIRNGMRSSD
jgi:DNA-binding NtrC family response regulator